MSLGQNLFRRVAVLSLFFVGSASNAQMPGPMGPKPVGVIEIAQQPVPLVVTLPGRAVAYQSVAVRPRVEGVIEEILYTPGAELKVGDPLFRIDDASYRAQVAADLATLEKAKANYPVAKSQYQRAQKLAGSGYTEAQVESARSGLAEAQASLDAAKAALEYSQTRLGWTTVTSPIDGHPEVAAVSVGDLVSAGQSSALTTIVRSNPIYVDMVDASAHRISVRQQVDSGHLSLSENLAATLTLENGDVFQSAGKIVTLGNIVSTSTGTFTLRFSFENPEQVILPGMFLRGEFTLGTVNAFLIPQRAANRDKTGKLTVFIVDENQQARQLSLRDEGSFENNWIVYEGLNPGDKVIVDGLKSLQPGQAVSASKVNIDQNGLTRPANVVTE
ncbi:efflux RND transporter periplasmic adaptor subunit [Spongiibacter sp. KMU-158]|uniref:Efflux RND transporter periplasmic adaptor subunit n=1 Tax=Spongiibacter pelagi TaxID=2760804 RepID=A0A927C1A1_9GAMM|nr:efflux RND transporter periplasmic adaptor subunit [Spongiibacter pelagi]MBD2859425.1 efflux RND transporter periplasmic adaptor subunit [Spongiibacter pelagi]